jgi:hypothetical protein
MLGRKERSQFELFISGTLRQLIPDDHVLVRVDRVLDLSWLRDEVADCYCLDDGRPGIDPEAAVRLMLAGLLSGIGHDRRLMFSNPRLKIDVAEKRPRPLVPASHDSVPEAARKDRITP